MYTLTCLMTLWAGNGKIYRLPFLTKAEITYSLENLTQTCKVTLPKQLLWDGKTDLPLHRGDPMELQLGYNKKNRLLFSGYLANIGVQTPLELTFEDDMFRLKQWPTVKKAYRNVDLQTLLEDQELPYAVKVYGTTALGAYRVIQDTVAELLDDLAKSGFRFFFKTDKTGVPVLHGGIIFDRSEAQRVVISTGVNLIDDKNLKRQYKDDVKVLVKVISHTGKNNKAHTVEVGKKGGETRTVRVAGMTEAEMKEKGEALLKLYKRDGLSGDLTTFGEPAAQLLDHVAVKLDGVRMGIYQVAKNEISFGTDGYRQKIKLGRRVD